MHQYKQSLILLCRSWRPVLLFEIVYKLFAVALFTPILVGLFNFSLKIAGVPYLSEENAIAYLTDPLTLLLLLVILLLMTFFTLIEMSAMIYCFHCGYHHVKVTVRDMFYTGFKSAARVFRKGNLLLIVFVIFIIPITNITLVSGYISSIAIPEFIMDYIKANTLLLTLFAGLMAILVLLAIRWIFSIHYFTLEGHCFKEARQHSRSLMKGNYVTSVLGILLWNVFIGALVFLFAAVIVLLLILAVKLFCPADLAYTIALGSVGIFLTLLALIAWCFTVPVAFAFISTVFYNDKVGKGEEIFAKGALAPLPKKSISRKLGIILICLAVVLNGAYLGIAKVTDYFDRLAFLDLPEVTAHRGDSLHAPENTMPAFLGAIDDMADYVELDVHQTKDGVIVVMHDDNLKRIAGLNLHIWDVTYEELQKIDVGSWFGSDFSDVRISTLDEVIKACKGKIKLNIELKPTPHDVDLEKDVIAVVKNNDFVDDCVLASLNADALIHVKKLAPDITTVYLMALAYGDIYDMDYADGFSIESSSITEDMVRKMHERDKELYAWTVNNEENMKKMVTVGVDNIITDDPVSARELIYSDMMNDHLRAIVKVFFPSEE